MNELSEARDFEKLITLRDIFNRLNQITWSIRQAETRFQVGTPEGEKSLLIQYESLLKKLLEVAKEAGKVKE